MSVWESVLAHLATAPCCWLFLSTAVVLWLCHGLATRLSAMQEICARLKRKRQARQEAFNRTKLELAQAPPQELDIMSLSDEDLLRGLQSRQLRAQDVLQAFIRRALEVHERTNCITEFISEAHDWARSLDEMAEVRGPLHGLPVSIKDNCGVKGLDNTLGLGKNCFQPAADHAVIVKVLLDLGAVPFCKTNVPQTLLSYGCTNPVFGTTTNFLNSNLSPGGSSGGESSLIAGGGSVIGIGSDIGGSVRIPAHFTGVVGFKPTKDRLSGVGFAASLPNVVGVAGVPGLLGRDVRTVALVFRLLVEDKMHLYDPLTLPLPWNEQAFARKSKLRVGYYTSLPFFPVVGDTERVVLQAKAALEHDGHTVLPFAMPDSFQMMELVADFSFADGGSHLRKAWYGEQIPSSLALNFLVFHLPVWLRRLAARVLELPLPFVHSRRGATFLRGGAGRTVDLWQRMGERKKMVTDLVERWKAMELDVVLCPSFPFPAVPSSMGGRMQAAVVHSMIWNLFDFPAGVVRFGQETGAKLVESYDTQNDFMLRSAPEAARQAIGMPISVQVVGLPWNEEVVLRGMQILSRLAPKSSPCQDK